MNGITDEMIEAGAQAIAEEIGMRGQLYPVESPDFPAHRRRVAEVVLAAALAGRAVVDLPEPAGEDADGPYWMGSRAAIQADVERSVPIVRTEWEDFEADAAEADALARLAAVREARRLAAGQSSEAAGGVL